MRGLVGQAHHCTMPLASSPRVLRPAARPCSPKDDDSEQPESDQDGRNRLLDIMVVGGGPVSERRMLQQMDRDGPKRDGQQGDHHGPQLRPVARG